MLLTEIQMKGIIAQLNCSRQGDDLAEEDVSAVYFRVDLFSYGNTQTINRHIDIDFVFGEYVELQENEALYQHIFALCHLQKLAKDNELSVILYQR